MNNIYLLTDYKGNFGSKWDAFPYNSGFDKNELKRLFENAGYSIDFIMFSEVYALDKLTDAFFLYTSSEDVGYHYKSFIEDIILYIENNGGKLIPPYNFLRANNNKVYMELMRYAVGDRWEDDLKSWVFGSYEEMEKGIDTISYPIVIKTAAGAMSRGVFLAKNKQELINQVKRISRTKHLFQDIKDYLRPFKHKGYARNSLYRNKFILQQFIPNLKNDWKIIIFGSRYYILTRFTKENDFRASGSHHNYLAGSKAVMPEGIFEFARKVYDGLNVPHLSLDIVFDGLKFYLVEFQAIYFGTSTYNLSDVYYTQENNQWVPKQNNLTIEEIYVDGLVSFLKQK